MQKYAIINNEGFPNAFYSSEIHGVKGEDGSSVPASAVKITTEQWQEFINNQGFRKWDGASVVPYEPPPVDQGALDQDTINRALATEGSIVRALGLVMFEEINKLRQRASLPQYTLAQFQTALLAKIRDKA